MTILRTIREVQDWSDELRKKSLSIGFVPTMGYLHRGHAALVERAKNENAVVAVSIFVNPTQFAANEDLSRYPRDFERDCTLLREYNCDMVFAPAVEEMYPKGFATTMHVSGITQYFEGAIRPTHFDGVAVIVAKLLLAVKPHTAYFGQKDYQQTLLVRRMVADLNLDLKVNIIPTIREEDGLALSSRNVYLSGIDRINALSISRALDNVRRAVSQGIRRRAVLDEIVMKTLSETSALQVEYAMCVDSNTLLPKEEFDAGDELVCLIAARVSNTRLIDNILIRISS